MATIRFLQDYDLQNRRGKRYRRGEKLETNEGTARRYIRRGVAERIDDLAAGGSQLFGSDKPADDGVTLDSRETKPAAKKSGKAGGKKPQRLE